MKIEMDAAVKVYAFRVLAEIMGPEFANERARMRGRALMSVLEGMVASGAADHKYDEGRKLDTFLSTERLVQNWSWVFSGDEFRIDRSERDVVEIRGKRTKYFNNRWLAQDPSNPIPSWPH
ncbi:hypothetical protein [Bradyrhizobium sp. CCBAU 53415]|uniref:hypothetical protein n=1 Tax=Bradyrhizobium sp. CCBAU 53415 TaxID=1325119 RepID=UPI002305EE0E|nr:hypothetical protein [Bradyrhizobium sp. CCBAU 53415]MDA9467518.1 hypothetical protein [Bradyrhizobium sp. CCBAU 53415]